MENAEKVEFVERFGMSESQYKETEEKVAAAHAALKDALSGAVKKLTDEIHIQAHDYFMDMMESDETYNFRNFVMQRSRSIMKGLLNGGWDEAEAKKWLGSYDFEAYRKAVYDAHREVIQNELIEDLRKENKRLSESLESYRRREHY